MLTVSMKLLVTGKCPCMQIQGRRQHSKQTTDYISLMSYPLGSAFIFQRLMQVILTGLEAFSSVYLNDIIVYSHDVEKQLTHLEAAFSSLRRAGLK